MLIRYRQEEGEEGRFNPNHMVKLEEWRDYNPETDRSDMVVGTYIALSGGDGVRIRGMTPDQVENAINNGETLVSQARPQRPPRRRDRDRTVNFAAQTSPSPGWQAVPISDVQQEVMATDVVDSTPPSPLD